MMSSCRETWWSSAHCWSAGYGGARNRVRAASQAHKALAGRQAGKVAEYHTWPDQGIREGLPLTVIGFECCCNCYKEEEGFNGFRQVLTWNTYVRNIFPLGLTLGTQKRINH